MYNPIGNGKVICASIYCGPSHNFGNGSRIWIDNLDQANGTLNYFKDYNLEILTWHKSNPVPACNNTYLSDTEYILFFREKSVPIYGNYETKRKFYISPINKEDKKLYSHPTIKPLNIIENLIINSSLQGGGGA